MLCNLNPEVRLNSASFQRYITMQIDTYDAHTLMLPHVNFHLRRKVYALLLLLKIIT